MYDESLDAYLLHNWMQRFGVFRTDYSNLHWNFENALHGLNYLHGQYPFDHKDETLTYRAFPPDLVANLTYNPLPPAFEVEKYTGSIWAKSPSSTMRCMRTEPTIPRQPTRPTFFMMSIPVPDYSAASTAFQSVTNWPRNTCAPSVMVLVASPGARISGNHKSFQIGTMVKTATVAMAGRISGTTSTPDRSIILSDITGNAAGFIKEQVAGVDTPDPRHVVFRLHRPWPDFLTYYSSVTGAGWIVISTFAKDYVATGVTFQADNPTAHLQIVPSVRSTQ